jgi:hypothetical protein
MRQEVTGQKNDRSSDSLRSQQGSAVSFEGEKEMSKDNGGPAFPETCTQYDSDHDPYVTSIGGMTLRDYFAAKAMQAIINAEIAAYYSGSTNAVKEDNISILAYKAADSMLAERSK